MSCTVKNIDRFCLDVVSWSISGGLENNTTLSIELVGNYFDQSTQLRSSEILDHIITQLGLQDVLPLAHDMFILQNVSHNRSSSGVTTSFEFVDKYSYEADSYQVGLGSGSSQRSFGDVGVGSEYFLGKGMNHPEGIDGTAGVLFGKGHAAVVFNKLATPGSYLKYDGTIGCLPVNSSNFNNPPILDDPEIEFGEVYYRWDQLVNQLISLAPINTSPGMAEQGHEFFSLQFMDEDGVTMAFNESMEHFRDTFTGLYNVSGTVREVLSSLATQHGYVYSPSALSGGHLFVAIGQDFGKIEVLETAGISIPNSAIESSIEQSYKDGYSQGSFQSARAPGAKTTAEDMVLPRRVIVEPAAKDCEKIHGDRLGKKNSDSNGSEEKARWDTGGSHSLLDNATTYNNPERMTQVDFGNIVNSASTKLAGNYKGGLGWASHYEWDMATNLAADSEIGRGLAAYYKLRNTKESKVASSAQIINTFIGQKGYPFLTDKGELVPGWEMYQGVNELIREMEAYDPWDVDNGFWLNSGWGTSKGPFVDQAIQDAYLQLRGTKYILCQWQSKNISINGDTETMAFEHTYNYSGFGTEQRSFGSKSHYTEVGTPEFWLYSTPLSQSPFGLLADVSTTYASMTLGEFAHRWFYADVGDGLPDIDPLSKRGCIIVDTGDNPTTVESLARGLNMGSNQNSDFYLIAEDAHGMPDEKSLAGKIIMKTSGSDNALSRWHKFKDEIGKAFDRAPSGVASGPIDIWWDGNPSPVEVASWSWPGPEGSKSDFDYKNGPYGSPSNQNSAWVGPKNRVHKRMESVIGGVPTRSVEVTDPLTGAGMGEFYEEGLPLVDGPVPMPNRRIVESNLNYSFDDAQEGAGPMYLSEEGEIQQAVFNDAQSSGNIHVPYLTKISFKLVNELYDFSKNTHKGYLESMNVSINNGKLTASYTFSQKVLIPDLPGLYSANARAQQLKGI